MKKVLALIFTCCVIVGVFTACSSKSDKGNTTSSTAPASTVTTIPTKQAKVNDSDAISLIQSYSRKELGLTKDEYDKCTFMVNSSGKTVSGKKGYYILVTAGIKKSAGKNDKGQQLTTIDAVGNYYISFDGKETLHIKIWMLKKFQPQKRQTMSTRTKQQKNNLSRTLYPCGIFLALAY